MPGSRCPVTWVASIMTVSRLVPSTVMLLVWIRTCSMICAGQYQNYITRQSRINRGLDRRIVGGHVDCDRAGHCRTYDRRQDEQQNETCLCHSSYPLAIDLMVCRLLFLTCPEQDTGKWLTRQKPDIWQARPTGFVSCCAIGSVCDWNAHLLMAVPSASNPLHIPAGSQQY